MSDTTPTTENSEKLRRFRRKFGEWCDHWRPMYTEARKALRMHHNTGNEGQWRKKDLEYLREQGRSAFTMNIIHAKIQNVVGMNEDNRQETRAAPIGGEDQPVADLVNAVVDRLNEEVDNDGVESKLFEAGAIVGEGSIHLSARRDRDNPEHLEVSERCISMFETKWDPASEMPDGSDAKGVFWDRWVPVPEFIAEYPQHRARVDELRRAQSGEDVFGEEGSASDGEARPFDDRGSDEDDYDGSEMADSRWFNPRKDEIRVIHYEYVEPVRRYFLGRPGQKPVEVSPGLGQKLQKDPSLRIFTVWDEEWRWFDFVANEVLFDARSPAPFDGCTLVRYRFHTDETTGYAYGIPRNLEDPQLEVNKSFSQSQDHVGAQGKPGYLAERSAFEGLSVDKFEEDVKIGGSVATVADGALTGNKISERKVPEFSSAALHRLNLSMEMADVVSGIPASMETPAGQAEAAFTVGLREKKALRGMIAPIKRFQRAQKAVTRRKVQLVVEAMPDSQLQEKLGNADRFQVRPDGVVDTEKQIVIPFESLRTLKYDVELQAANANQTERIVLLQTLMQLKAAGDPVDPDVIFELAAGMSRSMRERLSTFARQAAEVAAQSAQQQEQAVSQQLQGTMQIEATRAQAQMLTAQEKARHNAATESQAAREHVDDAHLELAKILESADVAERDFLLRVAGIVQQNQQNRAVRQTA